MDRWWEPPLPFLVLNPTHCIETGVLSVGGEEDNNLLATEVTFLHFRFDG